MEESVIATRCKEMGRREGEAIGKAEGKAEGAALVLLPLGRRRFGEPSAATLARLETQVAAGRVAQLAERLLEVETWDDLLA